MNTDDVIDKIKKAVRLANKTSEAGERETAMRLARNLADKNGIAFDDVVAGDCDGDRAVQREDEEMQSASGPEFGNCCYILERHFGVVLMISRLPRATRAKFTWFGSNLNIDISKHVLHILLRESRKAYREACKADNLRLTLQRKALSDAMRDWGASKLQIAEFIGKIPNKSKISRTSFMTGFFWEIDRKLTDNPMRNDISADALKAKKKFEEYRKDHDVRTSKARNGHDDDASILAGMKAGTKVILSRPCEGSYSSPIAIGM